jgi:translocation and assembly module TamB
MRRWLTLAAVGFPLTLWAQTDDRDYLTAFLEDNLSGAGRTVTITGFEGALSSQAQMARIEIADAEGVWITLEDVVLDWTQSSLLSGELVVNELSVQTVLLDRLPKAEDSALPAPEAGGFALPELPVSVVINALLADRIVLGPAVLGEAVEGRLDASLTLASGEGQAAFQLERTDGPQGVIALDAAFSNVDQALSLDLRVEEDADGVFSHLLGLPGKPAILFSVAGDGPLSDFSATVSLQSDGVERLAGPVTLRAAEDGATRFAAQVAGDLAPLFLPEYAAFLGNSVALDLEGARFAAGRVQLDRLLVEAQALRLAGTASIAADGLPEAFDVTAKVGLPSGEALLLPFSGQDQTKVRTADLSLRFDGRSGQGWSGKALVTGLDRNGLRIERARLDGSGRIGRAGGRASVGATLQFAATGVAMDDPALDQAVGDAVSGKAVLHWREGSDALGLPVLELTGSDYAATANLEVEGLATGLRTTGEIGLTATDFSRFSALAGQPLAGAGKVAVNGNASRLSGAFDLEIRAETTGLKIGQPQADRLLAGAAVLSASVRRDGAGTVLRALDLAAKGLALTASGQLSSTGSTMDGRLTLADLGDLDPAWGGSLAADAGFTGTFADGAVTLTGTGQSLKIGQAEVDRLLAGPSNLAVSMAVKDGALVLEEAKVNGAQVQASAVAEAPGSEALRVTGRLANLALVVPEFPGPVTLTGRMQPAGAGYAVDLRALGPAGVDLAAKGTIGTKGADLALRGSANAALINPLASPLTASGVLAFDLALRGPVALTSLAGRVTLAGGRVAYPLRGLSFSRTELLADLAQGRAQIAGTADLVSGGRVRVSGGVGLAAPFVGELDILLEAARLRDPELYDTIASGALRLSGPLAGQAVLSGEVSIGETELLVPSTGFVSASDLDRIVHLNDSDEVRATRQRAGLGAKAAGGARGGSGAGGPDWALDVLINAPNRVFLRGRGLDAELGGSVQLQGTLGSVQPAGAIKLIRGRLDLLGKRLALSEASIVLEGDLVPYLTVVASNETEGVISTVTIEGPASAPEVTFSSVPELPQEEVLAWLLFGRGLSTISPLQALELANAVAVLAGRGGEGIIGKLRKGLGVDDLDISTAEDGTASVSAGKYIARNTYTEIELDQNGKSTINLNLDLRPGVTLKGSVGSDGQSGIGLFLEGDY